MTLKEVYAGQADGIEYVLVHAPEIKVSRINFVDGIYSCDLEGTTGVCGHVSGISTTMIRATPKERVYVHVDPDSQDDRCIQIAGGFWMPVRTAKHILRELEYAIAELEGAK